MAIMGAGGGGPEREEKRERSYLLCWPFLLLSFLRIQGCLSTLSSGSLAAGSLAYGG